VQNEKRVCVQLYYVVTSQYVAPQEKDIIDNDAKEFRPLTDYTHSFSAAALRTWIDAMTKTQLKTIHESFCPLSMKDRPTP
jgi:hypothetical protein